jgi:hypothetical protein
VVVSLIDAIERDLEKLPPELANSALAELARTLARELDSPQNSATSKSMNAKAMLDTLDKLRELAPPKEKEGLVHDIRSARRGRLRVAGGSGTKD